MRLAAIGLALFAMAAAGSAAAADTASGARSASAAGAANAAGEAGAVEPGRPAAVADLPSEPARLSSASLLLGVASAGHRLVAVGDRGHILFSEDSGRTWTQAASPTQALLTGVCFSDAKRGIAVGHDEVALVTADGGMTWRRTHFAPQAQQPLLDVWCGAGGRGIAVGAYGVYFVSNDYGASWDERKLAVANAKASSEDIGGGFHLNAIAADASSRLYVAAEAGHLYRSDDGGQTWNELPSPYEGSFFGVLPISGDIVLAFGLRGNLFRSEDAGDTWSRIKTGTEAMLDGGTLLGDAGAAGDRGVAVVGLSGVVLVSRDGGRTFILLQQDDRKGLAAVREVEDETLIAVGEAGVKAIREPRR